MVKYTAKTQRKMYDEMRQTVVNEICPKYTVEKVVMALAQIRAIAHASSVRFVAPEKPKFKCKCGHTEAWEKPTHFTCKKCAQVKDKIHQGKAYRDIRERADLNGVGMEHDPLMSESYNMTTMPMQHSDPSKRASEKDLKKLTEQNQPVVKTKDKHILEARRVFDNISSKLHFNATPKAAIQLFARYLNSVNRLDKKNLVHAACMFHCMREPSGKVWKKTFSNGVYTTSRQRRLKFMTFKKKL
jgi:hypothetical protein